MESQDLIYLVSCAVNREKPDPERVAGMDLDAIYKLASRHLLAATVAPALEAAGVKDERFTSAFRSSVLKNATMDAEMEALFAEMDVAGIWHLPLKGIVLQHLYPAYGMRQMSDHDILFDASRAGDVKAIMERLGFHAEEFGVSNHDVYYKEPVSNFEMHRTLFDPSREPQIFTYYENIESRLLGDGFEKHLSPEDFYLYVTAHEYKHYTIMGTGLRSLADIYVLLNKQNPDLDYIAAEAEKMGIAEFEAENRIMAQHIFSGIELTEKEKKMLDYILGSGVYGNKIQLVENAMSRDGGGKIRFFLGNFFSPINKNSRNYTWFRGEYPFFYKHKILLPVLPFYRAFRVVFIKKGVFRSTMHAIIKAKKDKG